MTDLLDLIEEQKERPQPEWSHDTNGDRWWRYHLENPAVYGALVRLARQWMSARPGEPCGMKALWERLRWETAVGDPSADYRLNNVMTPLYARALMEWEPDMEGLFRTRRRLSDSGTLDPTNGAGSLSGSNGGVFAPIPDVFRVDKGGQLPRVWGTLGQRGGVQHLIASIGPESIAVCGREGVAFNPPHEGNPDRCVSCRNRLSEMIGDLH